MTVELGKLVPDFSLPSSNGETFRLSDHKGKKVVIYFYPKDMTPGCTTQSCDFRDYHSDFAKFDTKVVGISGDSIKSHHKFIEKHRLPFELLADEDHSVCKLFDVWQPKKMFGKEFLGIVRSTFLIDEEGKLAKEWRKVKVSGHVEEVLEAVRSL